MFLSVGDRLGPYEILAPVGAGGMGKVYRAKDTKLKCEVALKVLPDSFARDPERMARFQRDVQAMVLLNHPNIEQICGVEDRALVTELVEGQDLKGPLPLETALRYAKQIAGALEAAHEKGIIHGDLKPANVKITPEGVVKVMDFGLAKAIEDAAQSHDDTAHLPAPTLGPTGMGVSLGTAPYISPEQASGKKLDWRADIWSFGAMLYEMLSGRKAFAGQSLSDTLSAVLETEPDWSALSAGTPASIRKLLRRCLTKDREQRLQAIGEARIAIEECAAGPKAPLAQARPWSILSWAFMAGVVLMIAVALGVAVYHRATQEPQVLKFSVLPPEKATLGNSFPAVSPDGRRLAFVARLGGSAAGVSPAESVLGLRALNSRDARILPGTAGASLPFWSPDSRFLGFFADGKLKKIDVSGGPAVTLSDAPTPRGGTWSKNDVIVFSPTNNSGLLRIPAAGGDVTPVTAPDQSLSEISHRNPWFLPDGRHFLYTAGSPKPENVAIYIGDLDSKTRRRVTAVNSNASYAAGFLLYVREQTLMAQPFDADELSTTGDPVPVAGLVGYNNDGLAMRGLFSVSEGGVLAYVSGGFFSNYASATDVVQLTWFDPTGKVLGTIGTPGIQSRGAISPDGRSVAVGRRDPQAPFLDIWIDDLARGTASRFTFGPRNNNSPVWSPDGGHIAFASDRDGGPWKVYQKNTSAGAQDRELDKDALSKQPDDWSPDGRYIIEETLDISKNGTDIWVLPLFGDRKAFPYLHTDSNEHHAKLSPNGRWLAYVSDETTRNEVYIQTFPNPGGKWQVSTNGGSLPVWSRNGKELFFIGADRKMMAVDIKGGSKFEAGIPKSLFDTRLGTSTWFDVSKDGRFLLPVQTGRPASVPITVFVNWTAGLKK